MPKKTQQDWEVLEQQLYAAGVDRAEVEAGARRLLAEAGGRQLAEARSPARPHHSSPASRCTSTGDGSSAEHRNPTGQKADQKP